MRPRFVLTPLQRIGVPLLLVAPILAATGILARAEESARDHAGPLAVEVEWPTRLRENQSADLLVRVENRGDHPITPEVAVSPDYLRAFVTIDMNPPPHRAWATRLPPIEPGGAARASIEFTADRPGPRRGVVRVSARRHEVRLPLHTWILP